MRPTPRYAPVGLLALLLVTVVAPSQTPAQETESAADIAARLEATEENARSIEAYNAAILAAQEGRLVDSIGMLEAFIAAKPPAALEAKATEQLGLIRAERRKEHVVEFNEAVKLVKKREFAPAEALLRGILADGPDEKMRRSATKQLGIIERTKPMQHLIAPDGGKTLPDDAADAERDKKRKKRRDD